METTKLHLTLFCLLSLAGGISAQSNIGCFLQRGETQTCSTSINRDQQQQVQDNAGFIENLKNNPIQLSNSENQRPVVTLTPQQEDQILRNFPELFRSRAEFDQSRATLGEITAPAPLCGDRDGDGNCPQGCFTDNTGFCRMDCSLSGSCRVLGPTLERICQPVLSSNPLVLVRTPEGEVVQLGQTGNQNQWILAETCDPSNTAMCGLAERQIPALFINLSGTLDWDFATVVVQSCVAVTGRQADELPSSSTGDQAGELPTLTDGQPEFQPII